MFKYSNGDDEKLLLMAMVTVLNALAMYLNRKN